MASIFDNSIEFLKGVGPQRAALFQKELKIFTYADLLQHYPFRYEDRTKFYTIKELSADSAYVQIVGKIVHTEILGSRFKKRLVAKFSDGKGSIDLIWFQGIQWILPNLRLDVEYIVFGKPNLFGKKLNIAHPEIEPLASFQEKGVSLQPIYPLSEKLRARSMDSKYISKIQRVLLNVVLPYVVENLPNPIIEKLKFLGKREAISEIHFPTDKNKLELAQRRLKWEELFYLQLRLLKLKLVRTQKFEGQLFDDTTLLKEFYSNHLPFTLTKAQKRVIREIYLDMKSGKQMNRLLQGDVGSGKTIVAFITMLLAIGGGRQGALLAPTVVLAQQHFHNLKKHADAMGISIRLLTGTTKKSVRLKLFDELQAGEIDILVGTHSLLTDEVKFKQLGLAVIDEQHRFGVAQRSVLWKKNDTTLPHILVMTATPIPRTLAMTLYGDLDISTIDELPKGRKSIITKHQFDSNRLIINGFIKSQIELGRQVYVVYPLIEESEKLDLKQVVDGYESLSRAFSEYAIGILHGKMNQKAKDYEMARFVKGETKIMVATTVIEVGVDVPNASVMIVESAERFGLSQLHQLRGRVGRSSEQSYCILISDYKLSAEARARIKTMVETTDGFEIAEMDLKLRGPGNLLGTQQSGLMDLMIADLAVDGKILQHARQTAIEMLEKDPELVLPENLPIKKHIESLRKSVGNWGRIS